MARKYNQALVVNVDGNMVCAGAPAYKADVGDLVQISGGEIGQVMCVVNDWDGSARLLASAFTTIRTVETVWAKSWSKEDDDDAEQLG